VKVTVRKRKDTGAFEARWRENGRRRSRSFDRKGDAARFATAQDRRLQLGIDADTGRETLSEFMEDAYWRSYALQNLKPGTRETYLQTWAKHILPRLGGFELREITPAVVEDFRTQLHEAGAGDPTVIKAMTLLQGIMKRAVVRGRVPSNPVREVDKPKQRRVRKPQPLAPAVVEAIRAQLPQRDAALVSVLAYQGLRPHEAITRTVSDIRPSIYVDEHKTGREGRERHVKWLAPAKQDVLDYMMAAGVRSGPVFPSRAGGEWDTQEWRFWRRYVYQPAAEAAGVTGDMRPYRLRCSFVSLLLWEGRSVSYVADQAGHSVATLARDYAGVLESLEGSGERVSAEEAIRTARIEQRNRRAV
jgi:integrase